MANIYDTTLPHRTGYYTVGLIDYLDPTHAEITYASTQDIAALHVLARLNDYDPSQIVVLDPTGTRLRVTPLATIDECTNGIAEGGHPSDFVSFR